MVPNHKPHSAGKTDAATSRLDGRVAIVTGGAQSIGAAIVELMAAQGARVVIADVADQPGQALAYRLAGQALYVHADISDGAQIHALVTRAAETFEPVTVLVNNAVDPSDDGAETSPDTWLRGYRVNVVAPALLIRAVRPMMRAAGGGVVINVASVSGHRAQTGRWSYNASKAALLQLTRSAALDLAGDRIRVVSVSPGWTWSRAIGALAGGSRDRADELAGGYSMLGRVGNAEDIAAAVAFLASDAAAFITGTDLAVDGGYLALGPEGS